MTQSAFESLLGEVAAAIAERPLDDDLQAFLNAEYPADGEVVARIAAHCVEGEAEGWVCGREAGGIAFGRVIRPGGAAGPFSVDVVRMADIKGPHHRHPRGEIDLILPLEGAPAFDGVAAGWCVYPPGSAHRPTVTGGSAHVLYLLPEGEIEFTGD